MWSWSILLYWYFISINNDKTFQAWLDKDYWSPGMHNATLKMGWFDELDTQDNDGLIVVENL